MDFKVFQQVEEPPFFHLRSYRTKGLKGNNDVVGAEWTKKGQ